MCYFAIHTTIDCSARYHYMPRFLWQEETVVFRILIGKSKAQLLGMINQGHVEASSQSTDRPPPF